VEVTEMTQQRPQKRKKKKKKNKKSKVKLRRGKSERGRGRVWLPLCSSARFPTCSHERGTVGSQERKVREEECQQDDVVVVVVVETETETGSRDQERVGE